MANMLDKYKDAADEVAVPATESVSMIERQLILKKEEILALEALTKALRKNNKLMKQEAARRKAEEEAAEKSATKTDKGQRDNGVRGFFRKLGDAICKAVPKVLTTLTTLAFGFFVKTKFAGKALQVA